MAKAKPFIKWAGGKGQLIEQLDAQLPRDFGDRHNITYIEPFVGGGAMLFGAWERINNPDFNYGEFATIRTPSGLNILLNQRK